MNSYFNKRTIFIVIVVAMVLIFFNFSNLTSLNKKEEVKKTSERERYMYVVINGKSYYATLDNSKTVDEFLELLPQKYTMEELNGNEKYVYIKEKLTSKSVLLDEIRRGDIMLYQDNCIVLFYDTFSPNYSYTKIGHINDLPPLGEGSIEIEFKKGE